MQQTEKYKLNLIEPKDKFLPDPLNENMEKVEGALTAETAARTAADTAEAQARADAVADLDQRLQVFEAHHLAIGQFYPSSSQISIVLGFRPKVVVALSGNGIGGILMDQQEPYMTPYAGISDDGFYVDAANNYSPWNQPNYYNFIAFD